MDTTKYMNPKINILFVAFSFIFKLFIFQFCLFHIPEIHIMAMQTKNTANNALND